MRRRVLVLLALAGLALAGAALTGAIFAASSANPSNSFSAGDWTPPSVSLTDPGSPLRGSASLSATASDAESGLASAKIEYRPAGGASWTEVCTASTSPLSCSFNTNTAATPDGLYDFRATAADNGANTSSSVSSDRRIDNTAPTATMNDPGANLGATVTLSSGTGDGDGSGVASVRYQYLPAGSSTWTDACTASSGAFSCSFDTNTSATPDGLYDFRAIATDGANFATTSTAVTGRRIDNSPPTSVTMSDPGSTLSGTKTFSGDASDSGSGIASLKFQYKLSIASEWSDACTATTSPYSCSFNTASVADGVYDLRSLATDKAGNKTASTAFASRRIDNNGPTTSMTDPGGYLRGSVTLSATASDLSGVTKVKMQYRAYGATTWTDLCEDTSSPYECSLNTNAGNTPDGLYFFRAIATDSLGFSTTSSEVSARIDNTKPKGADVQSANGASAAGRVEPGDQLFLSYSETMKPSTILSGWSGGSTAVTVRFANHVGGDKLEVWDGANTTKLGLISGSKAINLIGDYVPGGGATFSATMVQQNEKVTVTLGALTAGAVNTEPGLAGTMEWPPSSAATDLAGNICDTALVLELILEGGVTDAEF